MAAPTPPPPHWCSRAPGYPSLHAPVTIITRSKRSLDLPELLHVGDCNCTSVCSSVVFPVSALIVVFLSRRCSCSVSCPSAIKPSLAVPTSHLLCWSFQGAAPTTTIYRILTTEKCQDNCRVIKPINRLISGPHYPVIITNWSNVHADLGHTHPRTYRHT